jgi:hypothetical protein
MPDTASGDRGRSRQRIPRIEAAEAAQIFAHCDRLQDDADNPFVLLRTAGFGKFLTHVEEQILRLAVQPDSWGERTRARLVSEIITSLKGIPSESVSVEEIVRISNVVMPCFLLELGRRKRHVQVEFPKDPSEPGARFSVSAGPAHPIHSLTAGQLIGLVTDAGEELVGLCYFGDQPSRRSIEGQLTLKGTTELKTRPCRSSSSSKAKH